MVRPFLLLIPFLCLIRSPVPAQQCLTTLFAANAGGSFGGAVYFDLAVANPVEVLSLATNSGKRVPYGMAVWLTAEGVSAFGNETDPSAWTRVAVDDGTTVGAGLDQPTVITLQQPFQLQPGRYGMALVLIGPADHDFTIGDGTNEQYSDANLALKPGSATNVPFTGTIFRPRVWNGSICYRELPRGCSILAVSQAAGGLEFDLSGSLSRGLAFVFVSDTRGHTPFFFFDLELEMPMVAGWMGLTDSGGDLTRTVPRAPGWLPQDLYAQAVTLRLLTFQGPWTCTSNVAAFSTR